MSISRGARRIAGRRRVAVVTGTRAEYGLLRSTLVALQANRQVELQLAVTGMHLLRKFGRTSVDIQRDGFRIAARAPMQRGDDSSLDQAEGLARGVAGLARFFDQARSDVVLVLGDRIEALAGALAAVTTGRVLAHVHGGDVAQGDFDDSLRHAITKLAHVHLVATRAAWRRVLRLGEQPERVHVVGAPGLDELREILKRCPPRRGSGNGALIVQHPSGRPAEIERALMKVLLEEAAGAGLRRTIVYPNSDRGHVGVLQAIAQHARVSGAGEVEVHRSLPREAFLRRLIDADVLLGNSSSGIIEAPYAGTPAVNVGDRQAGRLRGGCGVVDAAETRPGIRAAIKRALGMRLPRGRAGAYGDGRAGERIAQLVSSLEITDRLRRKLISY